MTMLTFMSTYSNGPHVEKDYHRPIEPAPDKLQRDGDLSRLPTHFDQLFDPYTRVKDRPYIASLDHGHYHPSV